MSELTAVGEWFKRLPESDREEALIILGILHLGLTKLTNVKIETEDATVTIELAPGLEVLKCSEDN